ncbi:MAG: hypothetical protein ACFFB5_20910 [Promethearchaeota archaeon]
MNRTERMRLIKKIEEETKSRMLIYITGDRKNLETKIATDVFPFITNHLNKFQEEYGVEHISLFIYSTGGLIVAGFALVNLIREYCKKFTAIVPFKAHSCATLLTFGANNIIMSKLGQFTPIDPSISSPLGPKIDLPNIPSRTIPVNVEDLNAYIDMAKSLGISKQEYLCSIFEYLTENIHPLVLGQSYRVREQIKFLAANLLKSAGYSEDEINKIVDIFTVGRYSHDYVISRREAKEIFGLKIADISSSLEADIFELFQGYSEMLKLSIPYSLDLILGESDEVTAALDSAIIESTDLTYVFRTERKVERVQLVPPQVPAPQLIPMERIIRQEWMLDNRV